METSALYAVFHAEDQMHETAARAWEEILRADAPLHTSSYVLIELTALLQRRLGIDAVDALYTFVVPWVHVVWVDEVMHARGAAGLLAARRRDLSLCDCVSFAVMRSLGLRKVFSLDPHFAEQGLELMPKA